MVMSISTQNAKKFTVGTLGWTADDLDNPDIERLWERGRFEIVEGVLTEMPAAQYDFGQSLLNLLAILRDHVKRQKLGGSFAIEVDLIVSKRRVAIVDAVYLTDEEKRKQATLYAKKPNRRSQVRFGRLIVPPRLIIESTSLGHEVHDRETKFEWYAEARVRNYWILNTFEQSLDCFVLGKSGYRLETSGKKSAKIKPNLFPGLTISLAELWE